MEHTSTPTPNLHSGSLYWPTTMNHVPSYPKLKERVETQVAIIGGGMTGALSAAVLARAGIPAVLIEANRVASGSTAANTGLLQFSNDIMLHELAEQIGEADALSFYKECRIALRGLAGLACSLPHDTGFYGRSSLYCASTSKDAPRLFKEYLMLRKHGFAVEWGLPPHITDTFKARRSSTLVTHGDAEINPVKFAQGLIAQAHQFKTGVYENTTVKEVQRRNGRFVIHTDSGEVIASQIVRAVSYIPGIESPNSVKPIMKRTYALATQATSLPEGWPSDFMMWETSRPYYYFRTTPDGRMIVGGMDYPMSDQAADRTNDASNGTEMFAPTRRLLMELGRLFPQQDWRAEYVWSGAFAESGSELPFLG
ncbi:MAG: FAD-binding oxidoreductase, partial [Paenibacillus sp.]|nr:FAD-binding oxidoreductase [Paenibacillus sp.]